MVLTRRVQNIHVIVVKVLNIYPKSLLIIFGLMQDHTEEVLGGFINGRRGGWGYIRGGLIKVRV